MRKTSHEVNLCWFYWKRREKVLKSNDSFLSVIWMLSSHWIEGSQFVFSSCLLRSVHCAAFGILMSFSSHSSILPVIHMIRSSLKVCFTWLFSLNSVQYGSILIYFFPGTLTSSSLHYEHSAWRLCWAGETCSWIWWLWF